MKTIIVRLVFSDTEWAHYRTAFTEKEIRMLLRNGALDELEAYTDETLDGIAIET